MGVGTQFSPNRSKTKFGFLKVRSEAALLWSFNLMNSLFPMLFVPRVIVETSQCNILPSYLQVDNK